jgi:dipeptidyl aminopeptidase/acylaminoacyl peptidase
MRLAEHAGLVGVTFGSQGHDLLGVMYLARGTEPRPTVLLLHGCPGLEQNLDLAAELRDRGWNALVFHYRGCWGSGGRYDLRTITTDVAAAVDYLHDGDHPTVDRERIAVVGHSLGGWAAVLAAARDHRLRAVAVCGGVADLGGMLRSGTLASVTDIHQEITRFVAAEPEEFLSQGAEVAAEPQPVDLAHVISPRPLLIVHGSDDEWVPVEQARILHQRAGEPRRYVEIPGANHAFSWHRPHLRQLIADWLAETNI